jgi:hypothetical protein
MPSEKLGIGINTLTLNNPNGTFVLALYNGDTLVNLLVKALSTNFENNALSFNISDTENKKIKAFLFTDEGLNSIKPLWKEITIPNS